MLHLLKASADRRTAEETAQPTHGRRRSSATSSAAGDVSDREEADEPADRPSVDPSSHALGVSTSSPSRMPQRSPLSFVSSLSSTLLDSGRHALHEVKAGVRAGIGSIEAAAQRAQDEIEQDQLRKDQEEGEDAKRSSSQRRAEDDDEEEEKGSGRHSRRGSARWNSLSDHADETEEQSAEHARSPASDSADADFSSSASSAIATGSAVDSEEAVIRRVNFLRLLDRCEELCKKHLHAPPGEVPPLLMRPGEPNPTAQAFFRHVALLQRELAEYFIPSGSGGSTARRSGKYSKDAPVLNPDPRKDTELRRRVGFLATVAEKEASRASVAFLPLRPVPAWGEEEKKGAGRVIKLARGSGLSLRARPSAAAAAAAAAASYAAAGASTTARGATSSSTPFLTPHRSAHAALIAAANAAASASESDGVAGSFAGFDDSGQLGSASERLSLHRTPAPPLDPNQAVRAELFARSAGSAHAAASSASGGSASNFAAADAAVAAGEFQAELEQRALLAELHGMTEDLKANALRLQSAMRSDARVLDAADDLMERNLNAIGVENSRLKAWAAAGCGEMCANVALILALWGVFIATFVFIKIFPAPK